VARFVIDPNRINFNIERKGKEYQLRVIQRAQTIFSTLLNLLPSNYVAAVQGANYTNELKVVAVELAKIELELEDINLDIDFSATRSEFLYSIAGYLVFLNGRIPALEFDGEEFRRFVLSLIRIYFQGSVPKSIRDAVDLFLAGEFEVLENFLLVRQGVSGLDISDQFGFQVNVEAPPGEGLPEDIFGIQGAIKTVVNVVRPAHTLFRIRYIFNDDYVPNGEIGEVLDAMRWWLAAYYYDDFRSYWDGLRDRDRLGRKTNCRVTGEDHSADF